MTRLGIVTALKDEAASLTHRRPAPREPLRLGDTVTLMVAGMGAERAVAAARHLHAAGAEALLSWGTAGALDPALKAGTLLVPLNLVDTDGRTYPSDGPWRERLLHRLEPHIDIHPGAIVHSATVLAERQAKQALFTQCRCAAVDMESAALAAWAQEHALPFMSLRAIVDPADLSLPWSLVRALDEDGRPAPLTLLKGLARRPREGLALLRLARGFRAAQRTLKQVRALAGPDLALNAS